MQVEFAKLSFIQGVRYKAGVQDYGGAVADLPSDAKIDGKLVGDMSERKLQKAKRDADKGELAALKQPASEREPFDESAARQQIESELRTSITDEFRNDAKLRQELKDELKADSGFRQQLIDELRPLVQKEERAALLADNDLRKQIYDEEHAKVPQVTVEDKNKLDLTALGAKSTK